MYKVFMCVVNRFTLRLYRGKGLYVFVVGWGRGFSNRPGRKRNLRDNIFAIKMLKTPAVLRLYS